MKQILILFISIGVSLPILAQKKTWKDKINHVISVGATNSVIVEKYRYINDYSGFTNKPISLGFEIGYLISYQINNKLEVKAGLNVYSSVSHSFKYYSNTRVSTADLPNIPFSIEYRPFTNSSFFISGGMKTSINPYGHTYEAHNMPNDFSPATIITSKSKAGVNPIFSLGIGSSKLIKNKYRIEWLLSYNQGTRSLRNYTFIRNFPYVKSMVKSYGSHLNFSIRYYFKKYNKNE